MGAEVCELLELYLLGKLAPLIGTKNVGLYRDDGLAVIHQTNGPKMDRIRKDIIALFKSEGLSITIDTNLIESDFLDVSFSLEMDKFFLIGSQATLLSPSILGQTIHLLSSNNCHQ